METIWGAHVLRAAGVGPPETEEDLRRGDEALNAMSPADPSGQRIGVSVYEVALHKQRD